MDAGLTRTDAVAALGGGVVGDLAGFAAATILRGVDFVQIPTTLLAQVDSSVGGKVAVDLEHGKNLAGAFWQPRLVLMDPEVLDTLPLPVFMEGMAEVVKYGCIRDAAFFDFLAARPSRVELMAEMEHILYTCCAIKRSVVEQDERDTGERMLLNFGHTLGHAYELAGHYTEWSHGAAVAAGMCAAARLGVRLGVTPAELPERLEEALSALGLPTAIPARRRTTPPPWDWIRRGRGGHFGDPPGAHGPRRPPTGCPSPDCWRNCDERHHHPRRPGRRRHPAALQVPGPPADHRRRPVRRGVPPVQWELSQDIQATLRCMRTLDADASADGTVIRGPTWWTALRRPPPEIMDCGESGSTLRFLIPVALALKGAAGSPATGGSWSGPRSPISASLRRKELRGRWKTGCSPWRGG